MPRQHTQLFEQIATFDALHTAAMQAIKGKRSKSGAATFMVNLEPNLLRLERQLQAGNYQPGTHVNFVVRDPKLRVVSAAPFCDRVVHHALHAVIAPIFERGFIAHTYANRKGFGTHLALARYEHLRDQHTHVLRCDVAKYFESVLHATLKADLRQRISCAQTLWLCDGLIDQSPRIWPGAACGFGLPMGNLTSQFFANVYLNPLDHFCTEVLQAPYLRYVDDFALFANCPQQLELWHRRIALHLARRGLRLNAKKTGIAATREPAHWLGFVTAPGSRRLPVQNVSRFANRLQQMRHTWAAGEQNGPVVRQRVNAWVSHAKHANTVGLRKKLFAGGWFEPAAPGTEPASDISQRHQPDPPQRQPSQR